VCISVKNIPFCYSVVYVQYAALTKFALHTLAVKDRDTAWDASNKNQSRRLEVGRREVDVLPP